jgi:hypothetical protein
LSGDKTKAEGKDDPDIIRRVEEYNRMFDEGELVVLPIANETSLPNPEFGPNFEEILLVRPVQGKEPNPLERSIHFSSSLRHGEQILAQALVRSFANYEKWKSSTDGSRTSAGKRVIYWVDAGKLAGAITEGKGTLKKLEVARREIASLKRQLATERQNSAAMAKELRKIAKEKKQFGRNLKEEGK